MKAIYVALAAFAVAAGLGSATAPSAIAAERPVVTAATSPHYEMRYGYEHGGKWRGHWVLVK